MIWALYRCRGAGADAGMLIVILVMLSGAWWRRIRGSDYCWVYGVGRHRWGVGMSTGIVSCRASVDRLLIWVMGARIYLWPIYCAACMIWCPSALRVSTCKRDGPRWLIHLWTEHVWLALDLYSNVAIHKYTDHKNSRQRFYPPVSHPILAF